MLNEGEKEYRQREWQRTRAPIPMNWESHGSSLITTLIEKTRKMLTMQISPANLLLQLPLDRWPISQSSLHAGLGGLLLDKPAEEFQNSNDRAMDPSAEGPGQSYREGLNYYRALGRIAAQPCANVLEADGALALKTPLRMHSHRVSFPVQGSHSFTRNPSLDLFGFFDIQDLAYRSRCPRGQLEAF